jgi:hypothetical protein
MSLSSLCVAGRDFLAALPLYASFGWGVKPVPKCGFLYFFCLIAGGGGGGLFVKKLG